MITNDVLRKIQNEIVATCFKLLPPKFVALRLALDNMYVDGD